MPETSPEELILKTQGCGEQLCRIHVEMWGNVSAVIITRNIMLFTIWGVWPLNESTLGVLCQHPSECCSLARGLPAQHSHFPFNKIKIWFLLGNSIPLGFYKAHDLDKHEQNSPLRLMEDPNIELLGSWGRPITLYWLPAPGIPVNTNWNAKTNTHPFRFQAVVITLCVFSVFIIVCLSTTTAIGRDKMWQVVELTCRIVDTAR